MTVLVPIRYPLTKGSRRTLEEAVSIADERDASLVVLHVDLFYDRRGVTIGDLRRAVRRAVGDLEGARYVVKEGLLVEETILEEALKRDVDLVVLGRDQRPRWKRMMSQLLSRPDVDAYLEEEWEGEVRVVG